MIISITYSSSWVSIFVHMRFENRNFLLYANTFCPYEVWHLIYITWHYLCGFFISKSRSIPLLTYLNEPNHLDLNYPELLRKRSEVEINISEKEIEMVEQDTRTQAKGAGFFSKRSRNCSLLNVTPHYPILTFIKRLQAEFEKKGLEFNSSSNK